MSLEPKFMSTATRTPASAGTGRTNLTGELLSKVLMLFASHATFFQQLWAGIKQFNRKLVAKRLRTEESVSHNIVGAAVTLGLSVIMLILMAIVAGYFVAEAPSDGAFSGALDQIESVGGTAFILLAVALLGVPVVAIVGYFMRSGLGGFITTGRMRR